MTVASQVRQTLSALKGAKASLRVYHEQEQNQQSAEELETSIGDLERIIVDLDKRVQIIENQEPQYKGK